MITHQQLENYQIIHLPRESFAYKIAYPGFRDGSLSSLFETLMKNLDFIVRTKLIPIPISYLYNYNDHCTICTNHFEEGYNVYQTKICFKCFNNLQDSVACLYINEVLSDEPGILINNNQFWTKYEIYDLINLNNFYNCEFEMRRLNLPNPVCYLNNVDHNKFRQGFCLDCVEMVILRDWPKTRMIVLTILNLDLVLDVRRYMLLLVY
jgi:hypothetical protein